jgi:hypothetical protein
MAKLIDKKTQQIVQSRRQAYLQQKAQNLPKDTRAFCLQVLFELSWLQLVDCTIETFNSLLNYISSLKNLIMLII